MKDAQVWPGLLIAVGLAGVCITVPSTQIEIFLNINNSNCCEPSMHCTHPNTSESTLSGSCNIDFYNNIMNMNVEQDNFTISCQIDSSSCGTTYKRVAIIVCATLGVTNLITITLCSIALCSSRRKIASLKHIGNSLHHQTEIEERVVNNPAYEEQCSDLDTDGECASSRPPNKLSAHYSNLGPAYYESIRSVNQRVAMKGDLGACGDKGRTCNKRPMRHTEPVNCPHTYYHEVHSDELRQWSHRVVPSDTHSYSRLYH